VTDLICKQCGCTEYYIAESTIHKSAYCANCHRLIRHLPKSKEAELKHKLDRWSRQVKEKYGDRCIRCGKTSAEIEIQAHHLLPKNYMPELMFDVDNGRPLCKECHNLIHYDYGKIRTFKEDNMKDINWNNVEEVTEFQTVKPGGYIGKIFTAVDKPDKEYIEMCIDIAEGEYKDHFQNLAAEKDYWALKLYRSYKDSALGFFKAFKNHVEASNPGYIFKNDEATLVDKYIGIVLQEEEYIKNDGSIGTRIKIQKTLPIADIRSGNFKVPPKKELEKPADEKPKSPPANVWANVDGGSDGTPFNK